MRTIQIAVSDDGYAGDLSRMLGKSGVWEVVRVDLPDAARPGVVVVDGDALERLAAPLANPERVVLVDRGDGVDLDRAFEMGIKSVVSSRDPLDTVLLAIMAARLRASRSIATARAGVPVDSGGGSWPRRGGPDRDGG
jgi:DNA-binding NarL/FixJ family response regulator